MNKDQALVESLSRWGNKAFAYQAPLGIYVVGHIEYHDEGGSTTHYMGSSRESFVDAFADSDRRDAAAARESAQGDK